jgi:hypothetical protein
MKKLIIVLSLLCAIGYLEAGPKQIPIEGFAKSYFFVQTISGNASAAITLPGSVSRYSIWLNQSASFTFRATSGTAAPFPAIENWQRHIGSRTLELVPHHVSSGNYFLIQNGAAAQTIRIHLLGE